MDTDFVTYFTHVFPVTKEKQNYCIITQINVVSRYTKNYIKKLQKQILISLTKEEK